MNIGNFRHLPFIHLFDTAGSGVSRITEVSTEIKKAFAFSTDRRLENAPKTSVNPAIAANNLLNARPDTYLSFLRP